MKLNAVVWMAIVLVAMLVLSAVYALIAHIRYVLMLRWLARREEEEKASGAAVVRHCAWCHLPIADAMVVFYVDNTGPFHVECANKRDEEGRRMI